MLNLELGNARLRTVQGQSKHILIVYSYSLFSLYKTLSGLLHHKSEPMKLFHIMVRFPFLQVDGRTQGVNFLTGVLGNFRFSNERACTSLTGCPSFSGSCCHISDFCKYQIPNLCSRAIILLSTSFVGNQFNPVTNMWVH